MKKKYLLNKKVKAQSMFSLDDEWSQDIEREKDAAERRREALLRDVSVEPFSLQEDDDYNSTLASTWGGAPAKNVRAKVKFGAPQRRNRSSSILSLASSNGSDYASLGAGGSGPGSASGVNSSLHQSPLISRRNRSRTVDPSMLQGERPSAGSVRREISFEFPASSPVSVRRQPSSSEEGGGSPVPSRNITRVLSQESPLVRHHTRAESPQLERIRVSH